MCSGQQSAYTVLAAAAAAASGVMRGSTADSGAISWQLQLTFGNKTGWPAIHCAMTLHIIQ